MADKPFAIQDLETWYQNIDTLMAKAAGLRLVVRDPLPLNLAFTQKELEIEDEHEKSLEELD